MSEICPSGAIPVCPLLQKGDMFFALGILAATVGALAIIARALQNAPEAYEDEQGFHVIKRAAAPSAGILRRKELTEKRELERTLKAKGIRLPSPAWRMF